MGNQFSECYINEDEKGNGTGAKLGILQLKEPSVITDSTDFVPLDNPIPEIPGKKQAEELRDDVEEVINNEKSKVIEKVENKRKKRKKSLVIRVQHYISKKILKKKKYKSKSNAGMEGFPVIIPTIIPVSSNVDAESSKSCYYIRKNDLNLPESIDNMKTPTSLPSIQADSKLSTSDFYHLDSKDMPIVIESLFEVGLQSAVDGDDPSRTEWKPSDETKKALSKRKDDMDSKGGVHPKGKEVFVWSSKFTHGQYGSDLPMVKARGIVNTSPRKLVELLLDSNRVHEYNKMSLGRTDPYIFQEGLETQNDVDGYMIRGELKIIRSLSKAPFVKNPIELVSLMSARELTSEIDELRDDTRGFLIITRAVMEDETRLGMEQNEKTSRSEMLLGVNLVQFIDDDQEEDCCRAEFTTVTQMYSPLIPMMVAKRIALGSAANFIRDIQALYT